MHGLFLLALTFYRDALPIIQKHCQECHRAGEMAPMALTTYRETRPWAASIREKVASKKMPPWFADACCGHFSNDRSLSDVDRATLLSWAANPIAGDPHDAPPAVAWQAGWNLPVVDQVIEIPAPFRVPAKAAVEYQYFIAPTGFTEDRWISANEVAPGNRAVVHHVVVYVREPGQTWTHGPTKADILGIYAPGASPETLPNGMAKLVPAGSDLVFEIHYTPNGKPATDRTRIALTFAKSPPEKRVLTLQIDNSRFTIPAGEAKYRVSAWGALPNDALLLGFFPHMHLRGASFEYEWIHKDGRVEVLLNVPRYDFFWQLAYRLASPLALPKGAVINVVATFDNSTRNPRNPDPSADVRYGQQSWEEMMIGFFDVAVPRDTDKSTFFIR